MNNNKLFGMFCYHKGFHGPVCSQFQLDSTSLKDAQNEMDALNENPTRQYPVILIKDTCANGESVVMYNFSDKKSGEWNTDFTKYILLDDGNNYYDGYNFVPNYYNK